MQRAALFASLMLAASLAACGGSGTSNPAPAVASTTAATNAPTTSPTTAPTTAASTPASMPQVATVNGAQVLVGQNQHTLYVFSADTNGVSNCTSSNGCTGVWPPYAAPAGTQSPAGEPYTIITRSDGTLQWTVNGKPLYEYSGDSASGQTNGNGITSFGGNWSTAQPSASATAPPPTQGPYSHIRAR
jgi:predicted lipoprotein with Yx(FWY)xxD motif